MRGAFTLLLVPLGLLLLLFLIVGLGFTLLTFAVGAERPDDAVIEYFVQMGLWLGALFVFGVILILAIKVGEKILERRKGIEPNRKHNAKQDVSDSEE